MEIDQSDYPAQLTGRAAGRPVALIDIVNNYALVNKVLEMILSSD